LQTRMDCYQLPVVLSVAKSVKHNAYIHNPSLCAVSLKARFTCLLISCVCVDAP
jgi:hypothetical protein